MKFILRGKELLQGPVLPNPLRDPSDLARLIEPNVEEDLKYVGDAITLTRHKLEGKVPLIGFTGAAVSGTSFE